MKKKLTLAAVGLSLALALSSCAVYTIGMGKSAISVPDTVTEPETRLRVIKEREEAARRAEEERVEAIRRAEEEKRLKAEEEARLRKEAEEAAYAEYLRTAVYEYPETMEELTLPWNYRPRRDHLEKDTELSPLRVIFLPLDEHSDFERIETSIADLTADFIIATGTTEQLRDFSLSLGRDTVLFENAAVFYDSKMAGMDAHSASFDLGSGKSVEIAVLNSFPELPADEHEVDLWLRTLENENKKLEQVAVEEDSVIFALSSSMPGADDWQTFSPYPYRTERSFSTPGWFTRNGYRDVWTDTHFSTETDPGITRENGTIYERMDFLYTKNMAPVSSVTFSVAGMENRAIYSEILLP